MATETFVLDDRTESGDVYLRVWGLTGAEQGLVLDFADNTFKEFSSATTPEKSATEISEMAGDGKSSYVVDLDLALLNSSETTKQYLLHFHDDAYPDGDDAVVGDAIGVFVRNSEIVTPGEVVLMEDARGRVVLPPAIERDTASKTVRVHLFLYDSEGHAEVPDSEPTVAAENEAGTDRSANLSAVSNPETGHYYADYTVAADHALEGLTVTWSVVEGGATRKWAGGTQVLDTVTPSTLSGSTEGLNLDMGYQPTGDTAQLTVTLVRDGEPVDIESEDASASVVVKVREHGGTALLFTIDSSSLGAGQTAAIRNGIFELTHDTPGFTDNVLYEIDAELTVNAETIDGSEIVPVWGE